jgi:hypothetical protein
MEICQSIRATAAQSALILHFQSSGASMNSEEDIEPSARSLRLCWCSSCDSQSQPRAGASAWDFLPPLAIQVSSEVVKRMTGTRAQFRALVGIPKLLLHAACLRVGKPRHSAFEMLGRFLVRTSELILLKRTRQHFGRPIGMTPSPVSVLAHPHCPTSPAE